MVVSSRLKTRAICGLFSQLISCFEKWVTNIDITAWFEQIKLLSISMIVKLMLVYSMFCTLVDHINISDQIWWTYNININKIQSGHSSCMSFKISTLNLLMINPTSSLTTPSTYYFIIHFITHFHSNRISLFFHLLTLFSMPSPKPSGPAWEQEEGMFPSHPQYWSACGGHPHIH